MLAPSYQVEIKRRPEGSTWEPVYQGGIFGAIVAFSQHQRQHGEGYVRMVPPISTEEGAGYVRNTL